MPSFWSERRSSMRSMSSFNCIEAKRGVRMTSYAEYLFRQGSARAQWGRLPATVLTEVFLHLDDQARGRAGVVNKHWYNIYKTPRLWRRRSFKLNGTFRDQRALKYARSLGRYLVYCFLTCSIHSDRFARRFQKSLTSYLHCLFQLKANLKEFAFTQLELDRYFKDVFVRVKMIRSLTRFLRSQKQLVYFDMTSSWMNEIEGYQVLDALTLKCHSTVEYLHLEDYFGSHIPVYRSSDFLEIMSRFRSLKVINLNYNCLSNALLLRLAENCGSALRTFNIKCFKEDPYTQLIWASSWGELKNACRKLSVCICFDGVFAYETVKRILSSAIPLTHVDMFGDNEDDSFDPDLTMRYLARNYHATLQEVHIDVQPGSREVGQGLLKLVRECQRLYQLEVKAMVVDLFSLHQMFKILRDKQEQGQQRPQLELFKLIVNNMPLEYYEQMATVFQEFQSFFQEYHLEYHFQGYDHLGFPVVDM
ncbi:F-box only protein 39-like [Ptychodera flava]|uniref:F-box only protein 39-like n=1 Tax=Ptychodera flava TaxID=63121 RepID=UPI003969D469